MTNDPSRMWLSQAPMLMEVCADLSATVNHPADALRLFSAAREKGSEASLRWPQLALSKKPLEQATAALPEEDLDRLRDEGTHVSLDDLDVVITLIVNSSESGVGGPRALA